MAAVERGFMAAALALAARTLGDTWPNPAVGCILVKDGVVVGRGWTASGGRPHAETTALERAGTAARGATVYVTLEPCSHHGRTAPCADALIAAGVVRVVAAVGDPDPRVSGAGFARLQAAGVILEQGEQRGTAERLNAGFFLRVRENRPLFCLKTASSLDGAIAMSSGASRWITGEGARRAAHALRARFDAILVGSGTVLNDDPQLTCRLEGYAGRPKVRIVLDRRLRLHPELAVVKTARAAPTWIFTGGEGPQAGALRAAGAEVIPIEGSADDGDFISRTARVLADRGLTRVLIEGGGKIAAAFFNAEMIDELAWFRAPAVIGADGVQAVDALGLLDLAAVPRFRRYDTLAFGSDIVELLEAADQKDAAAHIF